MYTPINLSRARRRFSARVALILGLSLAAVSCDACEDDDLPADVVQTRVSSAGNFESYKTFAFPNPGDAVMGSEEEVPPQVVANLALINDQMRQDLKVLGFTEVEPDENPDLIAVSLASADKDGAIYWECVPGNWWGYWYWYWDPCAAYAPEYVEYTQGVFWVGLADPAIEEVVFAGLAYGYGDGTSSDIPGRVEAAMHKIFDEYPNPPIDHEE